MWRPEDRKRIILVLGMLSLVLLVMPSATAKFTGQHTFIGADQVMCTNCHPDVDSELSSGTAHETFPSTNGTVQDAHCRACHIPNLGAYKGVNFTNLRGVTAQYHAAALIECTYCHGGPGIGNSTAWGGSTIPGSNVTAEFENSAVEAHKPLYLRAINNNSRPNADLLKGANEACIACHTHAGLNATSIVNEAANLTITAELNPYTNCTPGNTNDCYPSNGGEDYWSWNITMEATW